MPPTPHPWALAVDDLLQQAPWSGNGLNHDGARQLLAEYGLNVLTSKDRDPWYLLFLRQFANPLVYMLIGAAGIKAYYKGAVDAAVIAAVLLFMALVGFIQEMKARKAMAALLSLSAPQAKVRREGIASQVDAAHVVPGDILVLDAGDRVA